MNKKRNETESQVAQIGTTAEHNIHKTHQRHTLHLPFNDNTQLPYVSPSGPRILPKTKCASTRLRLRMK